MHHHPDATSLTAGFFTIIIDPNLRLLCFVHQFKVEVVDMADGDRRKSEGAQTWRSTLGCVVCLIALAMLVSGAVIVYKSLNTHGDMARSSQLSRIGCPLALVGWILLLIGGPLSEWGSSRSTSSSTSSTAKPAFLPSTRTEGERIHLSLGDAITQSRTRTARQGGVYVRPLGSGWATEGYGFRLPAAYLSGAEDYAAGLIRDRSGSRHYDPRGWEPV